MFDCFHTCNNEVYINPCQPFYLFIDRPNTYVVVHIRLNGGGTVTFNAKSSPKGVIEFNEIFDYITKGSIEIQVKEPNGTAIQIPYGDSCIPFCGIEIEVKNTYSDNFPNKKCALDSTCTWEFPISNCSFSIQINTCTWAVTKMNKVIYNGQEFLINSTPTIVVGNVVTANPDYIAELNAIEATAFTTSIIGNSLVVSYNGTSMVDFLDNCKEITKICL